MGTKRLGWIAAVAVAVLSVGAWAAVDEIPFVEGQPPPKSEGGDAWCLVTKEATYKTTTEQVCVRPATWYNEITPAKYEWREEKIMVEPERKIARTIPATYKTEKVRQLVRPESSTYEVVPAQFETVEQTIEVWPGDQEKTVNQAKYRTVTERIEVEPARTEWRRVDCKDSSVQVIRQEGKDDCYTLVQIPARYETITKYVMDKDIEVGDRMGKPEMKTIKVQKLVKDSEVRKVTIPAVYDDVDRQVLVTPASVAYETVPAKWETIKKMVQVAPEGARKVEVPAKYETVTKTELVSPSQLVWRRGKGETPKVHTPRGASCGD